MQKPLNKNQILDQHFFKFCNSKKLLNLFQLQINQILY